MSAKFTAEEILYSTGSHLKTGFIDEQKGSITWSLEELKPGDWFIAIPSEFEDPHDDLAEAIDKGAKGVIVNRRSRYASAAEGSTIITVPDTRAALLELARYWRYCVRPRVVGVSGSMGRRATMLLLSDMLENTFSTHTAFMSNLGWFGCVEEILSMPKETDVLIFEAGAVDRGDIARIGGALDPDLVILTPVRHPTASPNQDAIFASIYCELLETFSGEQHENLSAIIYDDNPALQERVNKVLGHHLAQRYSQSGESMADQLPEPSFQALNQLMGSAFGIAISRAELWCALEAAKAMGIAKDALHEKLKQRFKVTTRD